MKLIDARREYILVTCELMPTTSCTIVDVAREANVSTGTVSRVMNHPHLVRCATRLRVEAAIRKLGYQPNEHALGLMRGRSRLLPIENAFVTSCP